MKKRVKFKCWNCERVYSLLRAFKGQPRLVEECPYCGSECVIDLTPYRSEAVNIFKGGEEQSQLGEQLNLPEALPTQKPAAPE